MRTDVIALGERQSTSGDEEKSASVRSAPPKTNVGPGERRLCVLVGLPLLALAGASRRPASSRLILGAAAAGLLYRGVSGSSSVYRLLGVNRAGTLAERGVRVERSITILRPPAEVYAYWRDFENTPRWMSCVESVRDEGLRSHWVVRRPGGKALHWTSEIIEDQPGHLISWQTTDESDVLHAGSVRFLGGRRGTVVRVLMEYDVAGGRLMSAIASLFGSSPSTRLDADLHRLKQILETGAVSTIDGQPHG